MFYVFLLEDFISFLFKEPLIYIQMNILPQLKKKKTFLKFNEILFKIHVVMEFATMALVSANQVMYHFLTKLVNMIKRKN